MSVNVNVKWWAFKKEWQRKQGTKEAEITNVKILNCHGKQTDTCKCGDTIKVLVDFVVHEEITEPHFGVAVFREDGIYCYGANTLLDGYRIDRLKTGQGWFSIEYKDVNLMAGDYRLSVAIWDKKEILAYSYHPGFYRLKILGFKESDQLINLAHKWWPSEREDSARSSYPSEVFLLNFLEDKWKKSYNPQNIQDICVEFVDERGNLKDVFRTGERAEVKIYLKADGKKEEFYLWVGLFRRDGVYCHGTWRKLTDEQRCISLIYPKLQLLPGEYRISVGIRESNEDALLACHHGIYPVTVSSDKKDHGIVYMEHKWRWQLP